MRELLKQPTRTQAMSLHTTDYTQVQHTTRERRADELRSLGYSFVFKIIPPIARKRTRRQQVRRVAVFRYTDLCKCHMNYTTRLHREVLLHCLFCLILSYTLWAFPI